jgi:2-C-methyl-D-erythritol 4-phosphate cytidylyltransferase
MGPAGKKEYRPLDGQPVLARALRPFVLCGRISRIIVTVPAGDCERVRALMEPHVSLARVTLIEGGDTRQESVLRALHALENPSPSIVLIHDGARPWVDAGLIERVIEATERRGACVPVMEAFEAVKQVTDDGTIARHLDRRSIGLAQTPQGFLFAGISAAHEAARARGISCADDGELYGLFAGAVSWVRGEPCNRKITWPHDLEHA